jgi:hypothetical protein
MGKTGVRLALLAVVAALGGCAPEYLPVDAAGHHTARAPSGPPADLASAPAASPPPAAASPAGPPAPLPTGDTCGAGALTYLIGKPKTEIPIPTDLSRRRVVCTTCMRTQDYRPDRLTILFDQQTGLVTELKCG